MGDSARTVTELYQALRPLILRDVAAVAAPAAAGGGMAAHALNGPFHSGSLAEGQAPWAATKVELVAHAALPDVHHPRSHAIVGGDHTASGLTAGWTIRATDATTFAWAQLQHGDLGGVSANQHHDQVHAITGADHTVSGAAWQIVGLTGTDTLGLLTPLASTLTTAEGVLKSDASGGLALRQLGIGTPSPARKVHILDDTGAQMRLAYDASNYMDFLVDGGGSWRIAPTGDIIVDPTGDDMRPLRNYAIRLGLDTSKYLSLHVAELIADTFVAEDVRSTIGGKIFVAPTTQLTRDLAGSATTYGTVTQRGSTTNAAGVGTAGGYNTVTQRGSATNAAGAGTGGGYDTIAQRGSATSGNSYTASLSVNRPTGVVENDVLVAVVTWWTQTLTPPTGWTQIGSTQSWSHPDGTLYARVYYRVAGASEPSTYAWGLNATNDIACTIVAYSNVDTADPIAANGAQTQTSASMTAPSVDAATTADMLLFLGAVGDDSAGTRTVTPPSGMTELADTTNGTTWIKSYAAHELLSASGATGTRTATISASARNAGFLVALRPSSTAGSNTSVSVSKPTGVVDGDVMVATVAFAGGTLTAPAGWTQVLEQAGTGVTLRVYRRTASSEGSSYTWSLSTADGLAVAIGAYYNVDTTTPVGGSGSQANSSSTSMVAPTVTPGTTADMLLFAGAVAGNVRATAPGGMNEEADAGATGVGVYMADQLLASGSATGTRTATLASATANAAALVSLRPTSTSGSNTSVSVSKPTGVTDGDVMVATVAFAGGTLTAPAGWTQVLEQAGTGVTLRVYRRTASSEGSSYTWSLSTADGLAVAIGAYYNVDTTTPIGGSGSQANSSSTSMVAPSVTPGTPADMLLFAGAVAGNVRATAPGSMTEEADAGATGVGVYGADQLLASSDATGTRTATLASATANAAALVSLRPTSTGGGSAPTTIYVKHNNLNNGDRVIMEARLQVEFMAVTSAYTEITPGEEYSYTVTRNLDGTGANDWVAGDAVVNEGQAGNGWIELYARYGQPHAGQTATQRVGPTIVGNVRKSSTFNDFRERWAIGNLNGLYDFSSSVYGFAAGDPTQTWISIDDRAAGSGGGLRFMNNLATVAYIRNDGTWRFSGDANNYIAWNGSTLTVAGTVVISGSFSGINYAGASTPGGAASSLVNQGTLATANSADWSTQVSSRPAELTDGRIATAIGSGGLVQSRVDPGVNWGSNPGAGYAGLLLGADYMGYWTGSAWKSYMDNAGRFYLNAGAANNYLLWDGSTLTVSGTITVVGGNAAKVDFANITATLDNVPNGSTYGRVSTTIIAGGLIQVGSGTKDSNLSGWHISSSEIVGQASGTDQVVLGTNGKIVAGAGNVTIDAGGVTLGSTSAGAGWLIVGSYGYIGGHASFNGGDTMAAYRVGGDTATVGLYARNGGEANAALWHAGIYIRPGAYSGQAYVEAPNIYLRGARNVGSAAVSVTGTIAVSSTITATGTITGGALTTSGALSAGSGAFSSNVGVYTSSPGSALDVRSGSVRVGNTSDLYAAKIQTNGNIHAQGAVASELFMQVSAASTPAGVLGFARLYLESLGSNRYRLRCVMRNEYNTADVNTVIAQNY